MARDKYDDLASDVIEKAEENDVNFEEGRHVHTDVAIFFEEEGAEDFDTAYALFLDEFELPS